MLTPWLDPACLFTHNDLVTLTRWMWAEAYPTDAILNAIEEPWKWQEELAQARTDETVSAERQSVREITALVHDAIDRRS